MMSIASPFIVLSLCFTLAYILGLFFFITDYEENKCEMTYMFEYPQFVRISNNADKRFQKYGLYAYSEGRATERARNMQFNGIPVLFIPGNAGSYKQVRSLASVALRKSLNSRTGFHFDYFTVDLNEELSGLNGGVLFEQQVYVNHSIYRILELYKNVENSPKSVVLVAHSMGGILARSLLSSLQSNTQLLPLVITFATPQTRPVLMLDWYTYAFYKHLIFPESGTGNSTTFVNVAGGYNDFLVPAYFSNVRRNNSLYVVSTSVPKTWQSTDHLCILWCKQIVLAVNRALFDSVDRKTKQISHDSELRLLTFKHHLIHHSGTKVRLRQHYLDPINIDNRGEWIESIYRQYSVELVNGTKYTQWYMIRYIDLPQHESVTLLALNFDVVDWVFACPAIHVRGQSRVCVDGRHLTHLSKIAPSSRYKRRTLDINIHELKKNYSSLTHVVVRIPQTHDVMVLHVDVHSPKERTISAKLPHLFSFGAKTIVEETTESAIRYDINFPQLTHVIQSYRLFVEPVSCTRANHHATVSLLVPWANEDHHVYVTEQSKDVMHLRLHSSRPQNVNDTATVQLTLDPVCRYRVSIRSSLFGTIGQFARFYSVLLVANITAVVLMILKHQLQTIGTEKRCSLVFAALKEGAKPYFVVTFVKLASRLLSYKPFLNLLPVPDWVILAEESIDFFFLPILIYVISVGLVWVLSIILAASVVISESAVQRIAVKFLARSFTGSITWPDYLLSGLQKLPLLVASVLIVLCFITCGGLALCLGTAFYFLKLTQMSQEYIEGIVWQVITNFTKEIRNKFRRQEIVQENPENNITAVVENNPDTQEQGSTANKDDNGTDKCEISSTEAAKQENGSDNKDPSEVEQESKTSEIEETDKDKGDKKEHAERPVTEEKQNPTSIFFHFTLFLLWAIVTSMCLPAVLTWAHNFRFSTSLQSDPSFIPGLTLSVCAVPLWHLEIPKFDRAYYVEVSRVVHLFAFVTLMYASLSLYRLTFFVSAIVAFVTVHQLIAPAKHEVVSQITTEGREENATSISDKVKAKLE